MTVVIGWLDNGLTTGDFTECVARLAAFEVSQRRLATTIRIRSGPQMPEGRNLLVTQFLETDADWLLMVDSDMVFTHRLIEDLLATADRDAAPVVGGLCFGVNQELGQFPTMYTNVDGMPTVSKEIPAGLVKVDATGAACVLTHRSVFEQNRREGKHTWFHRRVLPTGDVLGEDISWCWWLREQGVPIIVDTTIDVGHVKTTLVNRATY